ncbi:solute carrier family 25 member 32-like [Oscarella lobularis]|uniref:solute carrier family 25 member 32-like n=1 Tax=Oscarella lobularis TaxID=121494 RepID=UPI0033138DF8
MPIDAQESRMSAWTNHIRYEQFVAGLAGGAISTLALQPLDLIKVRLQVHDGLTSRRKAYKSIREAFGRIKSEWGPLGLWQGASPNVIAVGSAWGLYFLGYNTLKGYIQSRQPNEPLRVSTSLLIGCLTGIGTLSLTNPLFVIKTRMCLQTFRPTNDSEYYRGVADGLRRVYDVEGVRGLYKGYLPGLIGTTHGAIQFVTYDQLKSRYYIYMGRNVDSKLGTVENLLFAAASKTIAVSLTYPYQVVRSRLQDVLFEHKGIRDILMRMVRYEGVGGFYKGLMANLLRVTPACCITFLVYENVYYLLKKNAK